MKKVIQNPTQALGGEGGVAAARRQRVRQHGGNREKLGKEDRMRKKREDCWEGGSKMSSDVSRAREEVQSVKVP